MPLNMDADSFSFGVSTDYMPKNMNIDELVTLKSDILESAKVATTLFTESNPDFFINNNLGTAGIVVPSFWKRVLPKRLRFHMHDYCQITCLSSGRCLYLINNHCLDIQAGDILIINRNIMHSWLAIKDTRNTFITFNPDQLQTVSLMYPNYIELLHILYSHQRPYTLIRTEDPFYAQFKQIFLQICEEATEKRSFYQAVIQNQLILFSLMLMRTFLNVSHNFNQGKHYSSVIQKALEYISENLSTIVGVDEIADHLYMNSSYFSHLFKKTLGVSCTKYISFERLSKAAEKLRNTDESIVDICLDCGFNSISSFYRQFTKLHSFPPAKYRKLLRKDTSTLDRTGSNSIYK
ncbi:MAG TPA: AraC family transcriptional regulator [Christensenellaceae bacterium]|nr:AraC family transcriptional regulator [Christensenellaceae bacterium]